MKVKITKKVKDRPGYKKGAIVQVSNDYGAELIAGKCAKKIGSEVETTDEIIMREHDEVIEENDTEGQANRDEQL